MLSKVSFIAILLLTLFAFTDVNAATLIVTKTADTNDGVCNADCSLREAITKANENLDHDTIEFDIPGSGVHTILISTLLPEIDKPVTIDGTTQSGYFGVPRIQIKDAGDNLNGIEIKRVFVTDIHVTIRALTINGFNGNQIYSHCLTGCSLTVTGCYIGTDPTGTIAMGGSWAGIRVSPYGNSTITIGGEGLAEGNLISGNAGNGPRSGNGGIHIEPHVFNGSGQGTTNVIIKGNKIGTDVTGNIDLGNEDQGILITEYNFQYTDETNIYAVIGGNTSGARNIISGNEHAGISADGRSVIIKGNYIGTNANGTASVPNGDSGDIWADFAIDLEADPGSQFIVGGDQPGEGNLISGNQASGVRVSPFIQNLTGTAIVAIQGNSIGTNAAGTAALGNTSYGISIGGSDTLTIDGVIGGATSGSRNIISANVGGISVGDANLGIYGNFIGTDKTGTLDLGNSGAGISTYGMSNVAIGGTVLLSGQLLDGGNLISGNSESGIELGIYTEVPVTILRNKIGTNLAGTAAIPNGDHGILVRSPGSTIGSSTDAADGNLISGNGQDGIRIVGSSGEISGKETKIFGNKIGTNSAAGSPVPNALSGIRIEQSPDNQIGMAGNSIARNIISGNSFAGVNFFGSSTTGNLVHNNTIGTGPALNDLGNGGAGVIISGAGGNFIGGVSGAGNTIAYNSLGISISGGNNNEVRRNSIYLNDALGIDLLPVGVTANDPGDVDTGSNRLQNFPVITRATTVSIRGTLNSGPGVNYTIDFYRTDSCDSGGHGEGRYYLGSANAFTDAITGDATFEYPTSLTIGQTVVATATVLDPVGADDTSEFSQCKVVTAAPTLAFSAATYSVNEGAGTRTIIVNRSGATDGAVSVNYATANGTATAGPDYTAASGTLNFADGETIKTFDVTVTNDPTDEPDETINLTLANPTGGAGLGANSTSVLTIVDNDLAPQLDIGDVSANEGNSGNTSFTFTVSLSAASGQTVAVHVETAGGTATPWTDFLPFQTNLSFAPGETSKTVSVLVVGDTTPEPDETFSLLLSSPSNATVGGTGDATIINDDAPVPNRTLFDYDGDRKADLSVFRPSNGQWWLSRSTAGVIAMTFGTATDKIVPADFTGDGKSDVAFWRPSTGEWFVLRSEDSSFYAFPFGASGDIAAPADYDGDGKADAAVFRPSAATWYINKSTGGTQIVSFGASGDVPVPDDYDGDGKADVAIYRPSNGQWWLNRSTAGVIATTFGTSSDKPLHGDFTGDGKADIAFWRPSNGEWFVLRSENSSYYSFPFGAPNDKPSAADFDGDGKVDPAVFRPASATWYVNQSSQGMLIQTFGANGDIPTPAAFVP